MGRGCYVIAQQARAWVLQALCRMAKLVLDQSSSISKALLQCRHCDKNGCMSLIRLSMLGVESK